MQFSNIKTPELPGSVTPTSKTVWWRHVPGVCPQKFTPKKTAIKKNTTVSDREFDSLSLTVEFFDLRIFYLGEVLWANFY
jgi:hypothetical protein